MTVSSNHNDTSVLAEVESFCLSSTKTTQNGTCKSIPMFSRPVPIQNSPRSNLCTPANATVSGIVGIKDGSVVALDL